MALGVERRQCQAAISENLAVAVAMSGRRHVIKLLASELWLALLEERVRALEIILRHCRLH